MLRHNIIYTPHYFTILEKYGIYPDKVSTSSPVEEIVIDAAKQFAFYFCRFYNVSVRIAKNILIMYR